MNRKSIFSKVAEAEGRQRMIQTKAYGLVCTVTLTGALGFLGLPSVEAAEIKSGLQNTPINRVALDSLSDEQKSQVVEGQITDVPMSWINDETGNVEWITGFTLVYKQKGEIVPVPVEPGTIIPPKNDAPSQKVSHILPKTGTVASTVLSIAGIGLASFAGWIAFRNKKTRKTLLISLFVVGGLASSLTTLAAEVDFLSVVDTVSIELSSRFSHTAATHEDWEYVGYIPIITEESETETSTTGNVNIKYVDTDGNEIKDLYNLVANGVVSTTTTTTTTIDGVASSKEETIASGLTYDATTQKPTTITYDGKVYEFVQVKDGDVEQGLVKEGTTTVTYIYKHVPQVTTKVSESNVTGSVNVRYVDTDGNEIKDLYNLVANGVVSTTTTTTTTIDGVASSKEETIASGLTYDATTQKPNLISYNGQYYEFVQVQDGDVEQGLVKEGTTTVTYIYKLAPNTTETTSTPVTGTVITRYVDIDTGEEIVSGSTIVDNGVVANRTTTIVRDAAGEVVSETTETVPTGLTYDTTADKTAKNAEIALIRLPVLEMIDYNGNLVTPDADGYVTVTETKTWSGGTITTSDYQTVYDFVEYHYMQNVNPTKLSIKSLVITPEGDYYSVTAVVEYTYYIGSKTVGYSFVSVDEAEEGAVEEGTKKITYYYRRQAYEAEATTGIAMTIRPAEMTTSMPE